MARLNPTTTEVAALRRLGRHVDARWVDWAIDMLDASAQSDSICSLAAATTPFNAFEMADLVDSALRELSVEKIPSVEGAARAVATIRATQVLDGALPSDVALADLAALYIELNHLWDIQDFYLLGCAQQDLKGYLHQWYWPSATRENIDSIIEDRFRSWICEHPLK